MKLVLPLTTAGAILACSPAAASPRRAELLASCPRSAETLRALPKDAWEPQKSRIEAHVTLRHRLGIDVPEGSPRIFIWTEAAHHTHDQFSSVAARQGDGTWFIDTVGEQRGALLRMEPKEYPRETRVLRGRAARKLDRLLKDRCLLREPPNQVRKKEVWIGTAFHTLEIQSGATRRVVQWVGRLRGLNGFIADIVIGRGEE